MSPVARLLIDRDSATVELVVRAMRVCELTLPASNESLGTTLGDLLSRAEIKGVKFVDVFLDRTPLQRRLLDNLPAVDRRSLADMVALQTTRIFRMHNDELITDAAWVNHPSGTERRAACAALQREAAEDIVRAVEGAGFQLRHLSPGGPWSGYGLDLRPPSLRARQRRARRLATAGVAVGVGLFWLVALSTLVLRFYREDRAVARTLRQLEEPRAAMLAAQKSLDSAATMVETIAAADRTGWELASRLAWLSAVVPDSAFVTTLELSADGSGRVTGWTTRSLELQPALDLRASGSPVRVTPTSARQNSNTGRWEGFSLELARTR